MSDTALAPQPKRISTPSWMIGQWAVRNDHREAVLADARGFEARVAGATGMARKSYEEIGGMAVIDITGPMAKSDAWYLEAMGWCSSVAIIRAIREATNDPQILAIILRVYSPGGLVDGTPELASEIREANRRKPVYGYVSDMAASAAYWAISQVRVMLGNNAASVGSIGIYQQVWDTSEQFENEGITVFEVKSAENKGIGFPGTKVTPKQLEVIRKEVMAIHDIFVADVAEGRSMSIEQVSELADGSVTIGADAVRAGLMDGVATWSEALARFSMETNKMNDPIGAFATANPSAVQGWKDEGRKAGHEEGKKLGTDEGKKLGAAEERERFAGLARAFADRPAFVLQQFEKGADASVASTEYAALLRTDLATATAKITELEASKSSGGHAGVPIAGNNNGGVPVVGESIDNVTPDKASAFAKVSWAANVDSCQDKYGKNFAGYERYVRACAADNARSSVGTRH